MKQPFPDLPGNSGEIHFWRLNPAAWPRALSALRRLGLTWVSTYLSWRRHAPDGPDADLRGVGDPALNLPAFLTLCQQMGFNVILKPGPWICAEEPQGGYPDWLLEDPAHLIWNAADQPLLAGDVPQQHFVPCYLHPAYLAAAAGWCHQVAEVVRPFCGPHGPVRVLQLDNEPSAAFHMGMWEMDYNPCIIGPGGAYQTWLFEKYATLAALTAAHDRHYPSFEVVQPPRGPDDLALTHLVAGLDWTDFKSWLLGEHLRRLKGFWLEEGLTGLRFSINTIEGSPLGVPNDWGVFSAVGDLAGLDYYAYLPFDAGDLCRVVQGVNYSRAVFGQAWAPELMTGTWLLEGDPPEPVDAADCSRHTRLMQLAAFAAGLDRANFYMAVDRDHWDHAPVGESGEAAFGYAYLGEVLEVLETLPDLRTLRPVQPMAVIYDRHLARLAYLDPTDALNGGLAGGVRCYEQLYRHLVKLGHNPALMDSETYLDALAEFALVCLPGFRIHDRRVVTAVRDYLAGGGKVLIFGPEPEVDEKGRAVDSLVDAGARQVSLDVSPADLERHLAGLGLPQCWSCDAHNVFVFERRSVSAHILFVINLNLEMVQIDVHSHEGHDFLLSPVYPPDLSCEFGEYGVRLSLAGQGVGIFRVLPNL
jgi:hypothetical protein